MILRRYNESDINAFYEILHNDRLRKFISFLGVTIEQELEHIRNCMKDVGTYKHEKSTIVLKESDKIIANISVNNAVKNGNYCNV